ncbi:MAG: ArsR family transcriptional regulator, partial [Dehalococcoidia bacterium]|nr:ArsR family transcriptional regulator [Dehalococcoidia bacterium]
LLSSRRDGAWVLYSIDEEGLDGHSRELLGALRSMLAKDRVARQDIARLGLAKRSDP